MLSGVDPDAMPSGIKRALNNMVGEKRDCLEAAYQRLEYVRDGTTPAHPAHPQLTALMAALRHVIDVDMSTPHPEA